MSKKHPVVVVTGSSGAGTTFVKRAFEHIFSREKINSLIVEGDSFHMYDRAAMKENVQKQESLGNNFFSHFGPDANLFDKIEETFKDYGETGQCDRRYYLHSNEEAAEHNARLNTDLNPGEFTPWEKVGSDTDVLFYEGLHGAVVTDDIDMAQYADLKIGVVPSVNLEWIQKIHRDNAERGYSAEETVDTILRRMPDYINYITPQFSQTDINFQRVATVDTSNPFIARDIPTPDESFVVIRFKDLDKTPVDFTYLTSMITGSFMSRRNSIVVPGGKMSLAMDIILYPIIKQMINK
ncbi:phosphoribulokinase [Candidatus Thioglobus sp.]|jgi:phosphoribulokinase|uniref:phosphoribulokinase n=1 Tax=Candidatus Thioglobus sp. TaxID=2026721 RepID=UPI001D6EE0FF|nr:phosphoribulokinase [Candidatus Thioglobus sp.]MBT3276443.1 phosphoribulokinase [Candidatus Thioglobus sp.]MBT3446721.1 phosphoribulokinase [Candidatus Thioglobus sp.]MBT3744907.1 phosphoribulokinase [Candidatus Thioglobus sp.]MBT4001016.1 phosphoribulokinase [Candidatus Thioglobus sp.]MBT4181626.1 phosphoribulokinase [Candidatus Thioglobus sp.]